MSGVRKDIIGKRFGRLVVQDEYEKIENGTKWKCKCDCGNIVFVYRGKLTTGHTKSCGCITRSIDGLSDHKLYGVWANMKYRCYNKNSKGYHNYGGKGVRVCEEWFDFLNFYDWAIHNGYEEGLTIERIDSNGDYSPSNCEWVTLSENVARANKTTHRRRTEFLYYGVSPEGDRYEFPNANEFAREHDLSPGVVRDVANGRKNHHKGWKFGFTDKPNV